MTHLDPASVACLERTRTAVLNVLVGDGLGILCSGLLLRSRAEPAASFAAAASLKRGLLLGLAAVVLASYVTRRIAGGRSALQTPDGRLRRFLAGHVAAAVIAALAIPLGLAHGWFVRPSVDAVAPYWVAALALGFLSLPRAVELEGLDVLPVPPTVPPHEPPS